MFDNKVKVLIDNQRFRYWTDVSITKSIDAISTFSISSPFDPDNDVFTDAFQPLEYLPVTITNNDNVFFTGTCVNVTPNQSSNSTVVNVDGYSIPGVLNDCTVSGNDFPLELNGLNLNDIAKRIITDLFDIEIYFDADPGPIFKKVAIKPEEKVLSFFIKLAQQRNLVISSAPSGAIVFQNAIDGGLPVVKLKQGESPLFNISPTFNPQEYYSEITGFKPIRPGSKRSKKYTWINPLLTVTHRPFCFKADDSTDGDIETIVKAKATRMFANSIQYTINVPTWNTPNSEFWDTNVVIQVEAPDVMIYRPFDFMIRTVTFNKTKDSESASLVVSPVGAFLDPDFGGMPWVK